MRSSNSGGEGAEVLKSKFQKVLKPKYVWPIWSAILFHKINETIIILQQVFVPPREPETISTVPIRGSNNEGAPSMEPAASCWVRRNQTRETGAKMTLDSFTKQLAKTSKVKTQVVLTSLTVLLQI